MCKCVSISVQVFLKFLNLEDISPFCGATDTPVLDFWCLIGVSKPESAALFVLGIHVTHSLRLTSGATPADLLAASMTAILFHVPGTYCAASALQFEARQMVYRLSYAGSDYMCTSTWIKDSRLPYWPSRGQHVIQGKCHQKSESGTDAVSQVSCLTDFVQWGFPGIWFYLLLSTATNICANISYPSLTLYVIIYELFDKLTKKV